MIALITKDLRYYASQPKFRRIQPITVGLLSLILLAAAFELFAYAQTGGQINVGYGIYSILVIALFIMLLCFAVPLQAIEAVRIENLSANFDLLRMSPFSPLELLAGKLIASVIAALWTIWLVTPLFWLSVYAGGLSLNQLLKCGLVFIACISLFSMIGIGFALTSNANQARGRSYATILLLTFLPLILSRTLPIDGALLNLLYVLSPLSVLLSIIGLYPNAFITGIPLWSWMVCFYFTATFLLFWLAVWWHTSTD